MPHESLADLIERRLASIPADSPGQDTIQQILGQSTLRRVALEAADVAREFYQRINSSSPSDQASSA